jgi:hypothetical protein
MRFLVAFSLLAAMIVMGAAILIARGSVSPVHSWRPSYRRRQTNAGNWLSAPIAEVDKSTCGKLLASRMRREPGLRVVVASREPPPACSDAFYDPELDG